MVPLGNWSAGRPVAVPSTAGVFRYLKCASAPLLPLVMLWQVVQAMPLARVAALWVPAAWRPKASLKLVAVAALVATLWHLVQSVALTMLFVRVQAGVVWAPWQLTLLQVRLAAMKLGATPPFGVKLLLMTTGAGPEVLRELA